MSEKGKKKKISKKYKKYHNASKKHENPNFLKMEIKVQNLKRIEKKRRKEFNASKKS